MRPLLPLRYCREAAADDLTMRPAFPRADAPGTAGPRLPRRSVAVSFSHGFHSLFAGSRASGGQVTTLSRSRVIIVCTPKSSQD